MGFRIDPYGFSITTFIDTLGLHKYLTPFQPTQLEYSLKKGNRHPLDLVIDRDEIAIWAEVRLGRACIWLTDYSGDRIGFD